MNCENNSISSLPPLPSGLLYLDCKFNGISILPSLPKTLTYLNCENDTLSYIQDLSSLKSLTTLLCDGNISLTCLPDLPVSLQILYIDTFRVHCLPSYVPNLIVNNQISMPICNATNNPNSCTIYNNYVNIPDSNFAKYLITQIPSCLYKDSSNKYWMDTTCSGVLNLKQLVCIGLGIKNLEGLQYLKNLTSVDFTNNKLTTLPALANSIYSLNCSIFQF